MVNLFFKTLGERDNPCLVFLHGLFGNHRNLLSIAKPFVNDFYIIIPDMRNHGRSDHHPEISYEQMSDDLAQLLGDQNIEQAIIIGHSMGGKVAMKHALQYPNQTKSIFILDIAPIKYNFDYVAVIDNLLAIDLNILSSRSDADTQLSMQYKNRPFRQFLLQNLIRNDNNEFVWRLDLESIKQNIDAICQFNTTASDLYTKPCYFLAGADSDYVNDESKLIINKLFPNNQIEIVEGQGHWLHAENPELVKQKINDFLKS